MISHSDKLHGRRLTLQCMSQLWDEDAPTALEDASGMYKKHYDQFG